MAVLLLPVVLYKERNAPMAVLPRRCVVRAHHADGRVEMPVVLLKSA